MSSFRFRISNARQIVQVCRARELFKAGRAQGELAIVERGSLVVGHDGLIAAVGTDAEVDAWLQTQPAPVTIDQHIDGSEFCVLPGLVDGHTHPVWSGNRVNEFAMKLAGATYMDVHAMGGGINFSVRATRASSEDELARLLAERLDRMLRAGTTLIEAKSGYGLETEDSEKILAAGRAAGLKINFHGDELHPMRSGVLAAQLDAHAISHCEMLSDEDLAAMGSHTPPVFAVLLPTTKYILKLQNPPARKMIDQFAVPVALGSDFNPNAHCLSMALTMNMACVLFGMTMNEALVGATINAAASVHRSQTHGSLEVGKQADLVLLRAPQWEHLIYEMADPPIAHVVKKGQFFPAI